MTRFPLVLGVVSDTHGLVRPGLERALQGCERILHAGDVGGPDVLEALGRIAPLVAVRGNNDRGEWARGLAEEELVEAGGVHALVLHDVNELGRDRDLAAEGVRVVVSGHSHRPRVEERGGVLYLNPGSAGPRRFRLPISCARLRVSGSEVDAELVDLELG